MADNLNPNLPNNLEQILIKEIPCKDNEYDHYICFL